MDLSTASNDGNGLKSVIKLMPRAEPEILSVSGDTKLATISHSTPRIICKYPNREDCIGWR